MRMVRSDADPSAPNFTASFHAAQDDQQVAPRRGQGFAPYDVTEDDAPAPQKLTREFLRGVAFSAVVRGAHRFFKQRPAAGGVPRTGIASSSLAAPALGINQRAQVFKTVSRNEARGGQLP